MEEQKNTLMQLIMELRENAKAVLEVAPDTLPPQLKHLLSVPEARLSEDFDKLLESLPEEEREAFMTFMILGVTGTKQAYEELKTSLNRRIQPEDEERAKPRKFKGFKKRRGTW